MSKINPRRQRWNAPKSFSEWPLNQHWEGHAEIWRIFWGIICVTFSKTMTELGQVTQL